MKSLILATAAHRLLPLLMLLSLFLLLRGHHKPGGGFAGGLTAAAAVSLFAVAHGVERARRVLCFEPRTIFGTGLLVAAFSGMIGLFHGEPFLSGIWTGMRMPLADKLGTPLLFDTGVYLIVLGIVLLIVFSLVEE